jgi:hypothetical protein
VEVSSASKPGIKPHLRRDEWRVDTISLGQARELVARLHYAAGSSNTATFRHGLFRLEDWPLTPMGCAIWIPPTRTAAEASTDGDWRRVLALSRLAIEEDVPTNAASFLLAHSEKLIWKSGMWDTLITYADEWQGHTGAIYRAANWDYVGLTKPERVYVKDGVMVARKAGPRTRTHADMLELGAECVGSFARHKFVKRGRIRLGNQPANRGVRADGDALSHRGIYA